MRLQSFKVIASLLVAAAIMVGCGGGSPAPAPANLKAVPTESTVTLTWDATPGVEYWVFYAPTVYAPADNSNMSRWFNLPGGAVVLNVSSPYTLTGLGNGVGYSFTVNGRTGGGPGGPAANTVTASPRMGGSIWTPAAAASTQNLRGATYGGTYVAVGNGGTILSSTNATAWTAVTSPTTQTLNGVSYFPVAATVNGVATTVPNYLAVGDAGTALYSSDAVTWTAKTSNTSKNLYAVASNGGGLNVAVGAGGTIVTTVDGSTWTAATSSGTSNDLYTVNYLAGTWFAAGAAGTLVKSTDGLTWTAVTTGSTADFRGMSYGTTAVTSAGTTTAGVAYVLVGSGGTVLASTDAVTWTAQTLPGASALNAVVYGSQFVIVGNGGQIYNSVDAITWTSVASASMTSDLLALARGVYMYAAVGVAGTNLTSK